MLLNFQTNNNQITNCISDIPEDNPSDSDAILTLQVNNIQENLFGLGSLQAAALKSKQQK